MAALLCGALLLPGCGGGNDGGKIPADQARKLISAVQAADQYNADGRCARAHTKVRDARFLLGQVPRSVDSDVRQGIADGLTRLDSLIASECQRPQQTQTETTPTQTETTQTQTTQTETTPTETTPTQTGTSTGTTTGGTGGTPPGQGNGADNQG